MSGGVRLVVVLAVAAAAALAACRVHEQAVKCGLAYGIEGKGEHLVSARHWLTAWGYVVLALAFAGLAGWLMGRGA